MYAHTRADDGKKIDLRVLHYDPRIQRVKGHHGGAGRTCDLLGGVGMSVTTVTC
jgi:hypothetical protein